MIKNLWHNIVFFLLVFVQAAAQDLPLQNLDEVVVSDFRVKRYAEGHKVAELKDSTIQRNGIFLTSLLTFNSNIYFKENGLGMVSSPAFRGTNASHTAVIWNGININSQLNGQVDFNTINPLNYSSVAIRSGGGSVQFGTGAIGGSVHLNNDLKFEKHLEHQIFTGYGSFDTRSVNYDNSFGTGKWSSSFGVNYNSSDNDYLYLETDERNTNGEFEHVNINFNAGYLLNDEQALRLYHQSFIGDRNLSGTLVAPGRSRYQDDHHRTQLEWVKFGNKATHGIKMAHLYDAFKYFENKDSDIFSEGRVTTLLARYSLDIELSDAFRLNSFLEYNNFTSRGSSFGSPQRNDLAITALLKHTVTEKLRYNLSLRQDFSSDFSSPVVFSWDGSYDFGNVYTLQLNASRNFRLPTFNDLYWQPGGNLELRPERSYQVDLGHRFTLDPITIKLNSYYITTEDMIRWLPNNQGIWSPINVDNVQIYGAEVELGFKKAMGKKQEIDFKAHYAYTVSEDKETGEQLIYVPFHRGNVSLAYRFANFGTFYQHLYNGPVSIIGGELEGYQLANAGVTYGLKTEGKLRCRLGLILNNVFNAYYENIALRPMPNRNIQTQLVLNF
ncbi:TonB-dependent receptor plug domain-containing protein [Allomuricauda sp. SCSIO 65647]|uniref:TonB-dependent receptor plug domain-containing protein n=1 Tax=Allomuricauda sp. SCSIO 65647 TaxID=2908843 RepID=UPI001F1B7A84|nr:TonB-dependent receptor [Muricauda sp. SCSIO 65647]UJH67674.1 TonB-dependent receptor [Muricauda sp. SCSIO 65647]